MLLFHTLALLLLLLIPALVLLLLLLLTYSPVRCDRLGLKGIFGLRYHGRGACVAIDELWITFGHPGSTASGCVVLHVSGLLIERAPVKDAAEAEISSATHPKMLPTWLRALAKYVILDIDNIRTKAADGIDLSLDSLTIHCDHTSDIVVEAGRMLWEDVYSHQHLSMRLAWRNRTLQVIAFQCRAAQLDLNRLRRTLQPSSSAPRSPSIPSKWSNTPLERLHCIKLVFQDMALIDHECGQWHCDRAILRIVPIPPHAFITPSACEVEFSIERVRALRPDCPPWLSLAGAGVRLELSMWQPSPVNAVAHRVSAKIMLDEPHWVIEQKQSQSPEGTVFTTAGSFWPFTATEIPLPWDSLPKVDVVVMIRALNVQQIHGDSSKTNTLYADQLSVRVSNEARPQRVMSNRPSAPTAQRRWSSMFYTRKRKQPVQYKAQQLHQRETQSSHVRKEAYVTCRVQVDSCSLLTGKRSVANLRNASLTLCSPLYTCLQADRRLALRAWQPLLDPGPSVDIQWHVERIHVDLNVATHWLIQQQERETAAATQLPASSLREKVLASVWLQHATVRGALDETEVIYQDVDPANADAVPPGFLNNAPQQNIQLRLTLTAHSLRHVNARLTVAAARLCRIAPDSGWHDIFSLDGLQMTQDDIRCVQLRLLYSLANHYVCLICARSLVSVLKPKTGQTASARLSAPRIRIDTLMVHAQMYGETRLSLIVQDGMYFQGRVEANAVTVLDDARPSNHLVDIGALNVSQDGDTVQVTAAKIQLHVPYNYILATVVDNAIILSKAIIALHSEDTPRTSLNGPSKRNDPLVLPFTLMLDCELFTLDFGDDPFEAKLRRIFCTGLEQQAVRLAHEEVFQSKAEQVLSNNQEKDAGSQGRNPDPSKALPSRQSSFFSEILNLLTNRYTSKPGEDDPSATKQASRTAGGIRSTPATTSTADPKDSATLVENARTQLRQHHEKIWISQIRHAQKAEGSSTTPLAQLTMQRPHLELSQPTDLLVHARDFIHRVGRGVPKTFDCSVVFPFHLFMRVEQTWIQVRNYPIPFLYVPHCPDHDTVSWTLQGEYVIVDELGDASIARTRIAVPVVPDYTLQVVRTTSPVKFYSDVSYHIETAGLSTICWSSSYHPAIQDILHVLDTLTSPPVDPSPRLGFWDKIRLLFHARVQIHFCQGDFGWVMKGTRNPYTLAEAGAGLAKVWQGGPSTVWYLGHDNAQHEFTQIVTQESYAMGVPDFARCMAYYQRNDQQPVPSFKHYLEKPVIQIVGGVRMGIGWHLERLSSREEPDGTVTRGRLRLFRPHYSIRFRAPQYVKNKDHDTFAGFRSNCIHISTSIVAHESALVSFHLTPGFTDHLMAWLNLFGGPLSLTIREGALYPQMDPRPGKRFTACITDVEYKFLFPGQVRCGYFAWDEFSNAHEDDPDPVTPVVGLHIACEDFKVDMHQRRSWQTTSTELLGDRIVSNFSIREAEFSVENMLVDAVRASLVQSNSHNKKQDLDADFIELGAPQSPPAHVHHLRLASTPCFYYFKQGKRTGARHAMHECVFVGTPLDTREVQATILQRHADEAQRQMLGKIEQERLLREQLMQLPDQGSSLALRLQSAIVRIKRRIDYLEDRYDHLDDLVHRLTLCQIGTDPRLTAQEDEKFEQRCVIHNPRISWNNAVRNIIYQLIEVRSHRRLLEFDLSARAIRLIDTLLAQLGSDVTTSPPYPTEDDDEEHATTPHDVQTLIDQLLHDKGNGHLFVVPNETEEEKEAATRRTAVEDVLPPNYKLAHNHAVDLLNPQISFQSDRCPDAIVLLSSSRMRLNGRSILDTSTADMEPVKRRFVVDIHRAQIYVSPLAPAAPLPWIPLELLVDDEDAEQRVAVGSFRRVCQHTITGTIRYDRYNRLRWQPRLVLQQEEEECDTVTVQFPRLSFSATPSQYHTFYCVVSDLLMYQEPAEKERLDRLHELMLAMETNDSSLQAIRTQVLELQSAVKTCMSRQDRTALLDELYLTMKTVQMLPTHQHQQRQTSHPNKKRQEDTIQLSMLFFFEQLVWEMCDTAGQPFCEWILHNTHVAMKRHERSSTFALEIGRVHGNDTAGPILAPYHAGHRTQQDRIKMVRVFLASLAPVGGIPIVQHLEINMHPLRLQLTYDFGKALAAYIFQSPSAPSAATAPGSRISTATFDNDLWSSDDDSIRKRKKLRKRRSSSARQSLIAYPLQERRGSHPPTIMTAEEVMVMKQRASSNRTFLYIKIPGAKHCLSYRGPKRKNIEDLTDFVFRQPDLEYRNRIWSWYELAQRLRRDFLRAAIRHSGALLKDKLLFRSRSMDNLSAIETRPMEQEDIFLSDPDASAAVALGSGHDGETTSGFSTDSSLSDSSELEICQVVAPKKLKDTDAVSLYSGSSLEGKSQTSSCKRRYRRRLLFWPAAKYRAMQRRSRRPRASMLHLLFAAGEEESDEMSHKKRFLLGRSG